MRGNGSIIQELEAAFRGAGWNVIKVIWGSDWDRLFASDKTGLLRQAHGRVRRRRIPELQRQAAAPTSAKEFFGKYPELLELVEDMTDDQLAQLRRGGHDPVKVYNAYKRAVEHKGSPP